MDQAWNPAECKPTASHPKFNPPSATLAKQAYNKIRWHAGGVVDAPYDPENWYRRASGLCDIGYPDLAIGDAYKATLLVDAGLDYSSALGENVRLQFGMSLWYREEGSWGGVHPADLVDVSLRMIQDAAFNVILHSLGLLQAYTDVLVVCQAAMSRFPESTVYPQYLLVARDRVESIKRNIAGCELPQKHLDYILHNGRALMRPYPWIPAEYLRRSQSLVDDLSESLKNFGPKCKIRSSTVKPPPLLKVGGEQALPSGLGMFATKPIPKGGRVLLDITPVGVTTVNNPGVCGNCCGELPASPLTLQCCSKIVFCSPICRSLALTHYHSVLCGKDFSWLYEPTKTALMGLPDMRPAIFLRLLAMCIHQGVAHPLQLPTIARLMPSYGSNHPCTWNMHGNITAPIQILQALGIDVFADLRYDTWVLQTIWWRSKNNFSGELESAAPAASINPLYSFVNHSCDPNVHWKSDGSTTVELVAVRKIGKGEEIFTSYLNDESMPKAVRKLYLAQWFSSDCECTKCLRET
ncbi:MAG: hypothetical protein M1839_007000 [Geoglossum umbratile]|nr:MAG: hypothetical protein M1839_007000 [Geoglossum umbratile]